MLKPNKSRILSHSLPICLLLKLLHRLHTLWRPRPGRMPCNAEGFISMARTGRCCARCCCYTKRSHRSGLKMRGESTSFWFDVWFGEAALADRLPVLFSYCKDRDPTVKRAVATMLVGGLRAMSISSGRCGTGNRARHRRGHSHSSSRRGR